MEREQSASGPRDCYEERNCPQLGAWESGVLERAAECSVGTRCEDERLRLYAEQKGDGPGECQDTEMWAAEGKRGE